MSTCSAADPVEDRLTNSDGDIGKVSLVPGLAETAALPGLSRSHPIIVGHQASRALPEILVRAGLPFCRMSVLAVLRFALLLAALSTGDASPPNSADGAVLCDDRGWLEYRSGAGF